MAPFTRFQFDVATNKISWQLWPKEGRKHGYAGEGGRDGGQQVVSPFFVWVGDVLLPLPLSFPPCPVGEMPGESDGLSPPAAASRKDGRSE